MPNGQLPPKCHGEGHLSEKQLEINEFYDVRFVSSLLEQRFFAIKITVIDPLKPFAPRREALVRHWCKVARTHYKYEHTPVQSGYIKTEEFNYSAEIESAKMADLSSDEF